ncbi:MAG TPA: cytochrome c [Candidatus Sulfotelmatobacter sp.]|nr:cytochrome c [Candidatus Sulfotelmatobacter sp.]
MRDAISILISFALIGAALGAAVVGIAGFRGGLSRKPPIQIFADMDNQAKLQPQRPANIVANGISSQLPIAGTVARSQPIQTVDGPVYLFQDAPVNTGRIAGTTNFIETNPLPVDGRLLARGRDRFDIYCSPCHGRLGDGNGITKKIGDMPAVANLHDERIVTMPDGEIFDTITHGKNTMGAYGPLVPTQDRWAIVAYLRALQLSWLGTTNDLSADQQAALK